MINGVLYGLIALAVLIAAPAWAEDTKAVPKGKDLLPGIVGADDRAILADDGSYRAVGRLNIAGQGFCTATLIAPDLVATAAHCLFFSRTGRLAPADRVHFLAGYRKGGFVAHRRAVELTPHPDFTPALQKKPGAAAVDLAVVRLETPIPVEEIQPIPLLRTLPQGSRLTTVSYARDRAELPSIERDCAAIGNRDGVVLATCDVNFGGSGGPMFVVSGSGPRLAAVVSGTGRMDALRVSLGARARPGLLTGKFR
ncbi:MAG: trypsin-like serine protease [Rhodobacteraceae bacterium]|nr:trypsin-like serine protease [Paracoccaceae bacterium]